MRLRTLAAAAATAALIPALAACGSSNSTVKVDAAPSTSTSTIATPTVTATPDTSAHHKATITGLKKLAALGNQIAAANAADGKTLSEGLEGFWAPIEDHVKDLDADVYFDIEDAMAALESGDTTKTVPAAKKLQKTVDAFIAAHP